ncbi:MAG TPA: TIGR00159 family protein [Lachnospiraceae bacterium]|nr:TIGR00159 family protein [Lachnospiraceae bacterium]
MKGGGTVDAVISWLRVRVLTWLIPPKTIEIIDIIQILLIAYCVYHMILWLRNTRAYTLLKGIAVIAIFVFFANVLQMEVIVWLISNLGVAAFTAVIIIFQPELRKVLEQMGHRSLFSPIMNSLTVSREEEGNKRFSDKTLNEIVRACYEMGEVRTGALIVIERDINLNDYETTGIPVDAVVTGQLLINIFEHNTPLHDGAVIIRGNRVAAATCYLPLSDNMDLSKKLGTRHRAGVGISEVSDCLVIIVSEETGNVSFAREGRLTSAVSPAELKQEMSEFQKMVGITRSIGKLRWRRGVKNE